ncbi:hypothetical protein NPIL_698271 [Nephila pilipes]|uniref:Uncharacterized protein n=1 Tax=Nephila pilipes TaxID=299642 RepID=A0A8X6QZA2_NEPPI|nr:hypothetical protein NPIL_698271 [Nephila pilipes]
MDFVFVFCIPWILLSSARCRNIFKYTCMVICVVLFTCSIAASSEDPEAQKEEFLIKSTKVIEAVPNVLRRAQSITTTLPEDIMFTSAEIFLLFQSEAHLTLLV